MTVTKDTLASSLKLWFAKNDFCGFAAGGAATPMPPVIFIKISQTYSITVKLINMIIKAIYRTAIVNKDNQVIFVSNKFYKDKQFAVKLANVIPCEKEEEINTHRLRNIVIKECGYCRSQPFEIVKNDNNKRYIGIITETMVCEE